MTNLKILLALLALTAVTACANTPEKVTTFMFNTCVDMCSNNGGVDFLEVDSYGQTYDTMHRMSCHCSNKAIFIITELEKR